MKLSELKKQPSAAKSGPAKSAAPERAPSGVEAPPEPPQEPQGTTSVTPSGIEVYYQTARDEPKQRRLYRVNGTEVPSVTKVLEVLGKDLTSWAQRIGVDGVRQLSEIIDPSTLTTDELLELLAEHNLTTNDVRDSAADRGTNVHAALEQAFYTGDYPDPQHERWAEHERGFVTGIAAFLRALQGAYNVEDAQQEVMVGSLEHQYAGRFDLVLTLQKPVEIISMRYKPIEIPAGRWLIDLKTRKGGRNYKTDFLQLEAYEAAAVECGYAPTDHRGVVITAPDGRYRFLPNQDWCFEDFLAVRKVYQVMNEREVLRILREDLDATEVATGPKAPTQEGK